MEADTKQKEKEAEWSKKKMEYENKLAGIEIALEDHDIQIKWTEDGYLVIDLLYDGEEEE